MSLFERVHMPSFAGATEWLNSEPLGPAELGGSVVLVNFWTLTCERLRVNHWALAAEWTIGAENVELDQPGFLEPGSEAYAFTFGQGAPRAFAFLPRTSSGSAARDCCSLTKRVVSGCSLDGPITCSLDEQRECARHDDGAIAASASRHEDQRARFRAGRSHQAEATRFVLGRACPRR